MFTGTAQAARADRSWSFPLEAKSGVRVVPRNIVVSVPAMSTSGFPGSETLSSLQKATSVYGQLPEGMLLILRKRFSGDVLPVSFIEEARKDDVTVVSARKDFSIFLGAIGFSSVHFIPSNLLNGDGVYPSRSRFHLSFEWMQSQAAVLLSFSDLYPDAEYVVGVMHKALRPKSGVGAIVDVPPAGLNAIHSILKRVGLTEVPGAPQGIDAFRRLN